MKREEIFKYYDQLFGLFLDKLPSKELYICLLNNSLDVDDPDYNDEGCLVMQDFIGSHLKKEFQWQTTIGIIDAVQSMVEEARINANIK